MLYTSFRLIILLGNTTRERTYFYKLQRYKHKNDKPSSMLHLGISANHTSCLKYKLELIVSLLDQFYRLLVKTKITHLSFYATYALHFHSIKKIILHVLCISFFFLEIKRTVSKLQDFQIMIMIMKMNFDAMRRIFYKPPPGEERTMSGGGV